MRLCSIASGSSGNCIYVGSDTTHLLVDVGISGKRTEEGLKSLDLNMRDVDGILITHEHSDHIQSLGNLSKKFNLPVFANSETFDEYFEKSTPENVVFKPILAKNTGPKSIYELISIFSAMYSESFKLQRMIPATYAPVMSAIPK